MTGAGPALAGLLSALAVALLLSRADDGRLRTAVASPARARPDPRTSTAPPRPRFSPATAACVLAGGAVALLLSGAVGVAVGAAVAVAGPRALGRLETSAARAERERLAQDLPLVLDLLASCLAGGAPLPVAAEAVAAAVGGPAGRRLGVVASALAVGVPPGEAWSLLAGQAEAAADDPLAPAARALGRAADGGAPVAVAVSRLAADVRADARARSERAARRVGVLAVAPLGLCFLPAFVLIGIVPVVVSLAAPLLAQS